MVVNRRLRVLNGKLGLKIGVLQYKNSYLNTESCFDIDSGHSALACSLGLTLSLKLWSGGLSLGFERTAWDLTLVVELSISIKPSMKFEFSTYKLFFMKVNNSFGPRLVS